MLRVIFKLERSDENKKTSNRNKMKVFQDITLKNLITGKFKHLISAERKVLLVVKKHEVFIRF